MYLDGRKLAEVGKPGFCDPGIILVPPPPYVLQAFNILYLNSKLTGGTRTLYLCSVSDRDYVLGNGHEEVSTLPGPGYIHGTCLHPGLVSRQD